MSAPVIYRLSIECFRSIKSLMWHPSNGVNIVLGGGDVGKASILDAIALLLSPAYPAALSDAEYLGRKVETGFAIEAIMSLPPDVGVNDQAKLSWPWEWDGTDAIVPNVEGIVVASAPAYRLRVRGTEDLELAYEIVQPD